MARNFILDRTANESSNVTVVNELTNPVKINHHAIDIARGLVPGHRIVHKFGFGEVGTTPSAISPIGSFNTPLAATELEFVSDDTDDDVGGTGATKIVIQGLDASWEEVTQEIETNGTTAVPIPIDLIRLYRWYVSESGTYAGNVTASYAGTLIIREAGAGPTWETIEGTLPFSGQSEIGVYTVPIGYTGYLLSKHIFTDTSKIADVYLMHRPFANDVTTPFTGTRRMVERDIGLTGSFNVTYAVPKGPFVGPCDIGFMGRVASSTAGISVEFELLLIEDGY